MVGLVDLTIFKHDLCNDITLFQTDLKSPRSELNSYFMNRLLKDRHFI